MTATTEPARVCAGDTVSWLRTADAYPASAGWALSYVLVNAAEKITLTTSAEGDAHKVQVAATDSAAWAAGTYAWKAYAAKGTERYTVDSGSIVIEPNLAAESIAALDTRSPARAALDAVDAAMRTYGSKAYLQSYSIDGRQQTFRSPEEFMSFRSKLQAEVRREENLERLRNGLPSRNVLHVRTFGRR